MYASVLSDSLRIHIQHYNFVSRPAYCVGR